MMKLKGQEIPVSLYKFYMADALVEKTEFLKHQLRIANNSELFSKLVLHVYGEVKQFQEWQEQQAEKATSEEGKTE